MKMLCFIIPVGSANVNNNNNDNNNNNNDKQLISTNQ